MEIINVGDKSCVAKAVAVLKAGGVVVYPTDTLYGLGADALSENAVGKVYKIKGRDERKPIHAIVADMKMMEQYAEIPDMARMLAREFLPGPLTLILRKKKGVKTGIARGTNKIGFRIPNNQFCLALAKKFGKPITTTSANLSGHKVEQTMSAILKQLGDKVDLVIDGGDLPAGRKEPQPSTVVNLVGKEPIILREGAIPADEIWNTIRVEL